MRARSLTPPRADSPPAVQFSPYFEASPLSLPPSPFLLCSPSATFHAFLLAFQTSASNAPLRDNALLFLSVLSSISSCHCEQREIWHPFLLAPFLGSCCIKEVGFIRRLIHATVL